MKKFMRACRKNGHDIDALALDSFFYYWSKRLES
jgi:hypothetical protein